MVTAKIIGGKALMKKFQKMGDVMGEEFKGVVVDTAHYANAQAVNHINKNVKQGTGHLRQSMYVTDLKETGPFTFHVEVGNRAEYAGYVEFGTGKRVSVPPEFSGIAADVRSQPVDKGEVVIQKIKDWCKRLGIDVDAAYPIFVSILRTGIKPRPFMYPAYKMAQRYMKKESEKALKRIVNTK